MDTFELVKTLWNALRSKSCPGVGCPVVVYPGARYPGASAAFTEVMVNGPVLETCRIAAPAPV